MVVGGVVSPDQTSFVHDQIINVECSSGYKQIGSRSKAICKDGNYKPALDINCVPGTYKLRS